ncbi:hypothetical protein EVAR_23483_1 [Eumeta japonica]|uniref:Uncharacterized protein n=1 Tax=Eumeta variegata TaxID=151549 RepID=A0A4C1UL73_EUMVA|nr:hypothetical protein EVAR_23483_1 [Eumeta japonica]
MVTATHGYSQSDRGRHRVHDLSGWNTIFYVEENRSAGAASKDRLKEEIVLSDQRLGNHLRGVLELRIHNNARNSAAVKTQSISVRNSIKICLAIVARLKDKHPNKRLHKDCRIYYVNKFDRVTDPSARHNGPLLAGTGYDRRVVDEVRNRGLKTPSELGSNASNARRALINGYAVLELLTRFDACFISIP